MFDVNKCKQFIYLFDCSYWRAITVYFIMAAIHLAPRKVFSFATAQPFVLLLFIHKLHLNPGVFAFV